MGIKARLLSCHDLPAEEACYHHLCAKKLSLSKANLSSPPSGRKRGRPKNEIQEHLFNQLCKWIENETDLYTLTKLYAKMKNTFLLVCNILEKSLLKSMGRKK